MSAAREAAYGLYPKGSKIDPGLMEEISAMWSDELLFTPSG